MSARHESYSVMHKSSMASGKATGQIWKVLNMWEHLSLEWRSACH